MLSATSTNAQAPVITSPQDLNIIAANEQFDPVSNTWSTKAPMPTARWGLYTQAVGGKIYAIGGQLDTVDCSPLAIIKAYDPAANNGAGSWTALPDWPSPPASANGPRVGGAAAATADGKIYIAGGQGQSQICTSADVATMEAFDPATNTWTTKAPMVADVGTPTGGRTHCGMAAIFDNSLGHEVLYAVGGRHQLTNSDLDSVEMYDPVANSWTVKQHLNHLRYGAAVAAVNGKIYAIGGNGFPLATEEFDPTANGGLGKWTDKAPMQIYQGAFNWGAVGVISGKIYVAGGNDGAGHQLAIVEVFDPLAGPDGTWSYAPPMPTGRDALGCAVINNQLYAIGGILDGGFATAGRPFVYQVSATNHPTSYSASGLSSGLSIDPTTGIISGLPPVHLYDVRATVTATNANGSDTEPLVYSVSEPYPAPSPIIVSSTSATGRVGEQFGPDGAGFQVLARNAGPAAQFTAGGLPPGLSINKDTGLILGTPTATGNFGVSLNVTDIVSGVPVTTSNHLQLTFIDDSAHSVPIIDSPSNVPLVPNQPFSYPIHADADGTFSYIGSDGLKHKDPGSTAGLPAGLYFDGVNKILGTFTGSTAAPTGGGIAAASNIAEAAVGPDRPIRPKTLTIRPPGSGGIQTCNLVANEGGATGVRPLNFVPCGYTSSGLPITITVDALPVQEDNSQVLQGGYNSDCSVTVTASPDSCKYSFVSWTENGVVQKNSPSYTFTPTEDRSLVANFTVVNNTITTSAATGGTASGGGIFSCGSSVTVTATPDSCHTFASWSDQNGVISDAPASYTFTASGDRTLTANFNPINYTITAQTAGNGSVGGGGSVACESSATVTATPNTGYSFISWSEANVVISGAGQSYTFPVTGDRTLTANFADITPPVITVPAPGAVEADGPDGAMVTFTAPTANDSADGPVPVSCSASSGATFPVGTTTVNCSASDSHGNPANANFDVIVQDRTPPVITTPGNMTVKGGKTGGSASFDVCASDIVDGTVTAIPSSTPGVFSLGLHTITVTAADSHGNAATPGSFTINVVKKVKASKKLPVVTISALASNINQGGNTSFVVSASGMNSAQPLLVSYTLSGSAVLSNDYTLTGAGCGLQQITIPAGSSTGQAQVTLNGRLTSSTTSKTVTMGLQAGSYTIGSPSTATVTINGSGP